MYITWESNSVDFIFCVPILQTILMPRCGKCNKKSIMLDCCKFCKVDLCLKCLSPVRHNCEKIGEWKSKGKEELSEQLMSNKCVQRKVENV